MNTNITKDELMKVKGMALGCLSPEYQGLIKEISKADNKCLFFRFEGEWRFTTDPTWNLGRAYFPGDEQIDAYYNKPKLSVKRQNSRRILTSK